MNTYRHLGKLIFDIAFVDELQELGERPVAQGAASVTLADVTITATGTVKVQGAESTALDALVIAATGTAKIQGAAAVALDALTDTATATSKIQGAASVSLDDVSDTATGTVKVQGSESTALDALTIAATGTVLVRGAESTLLDDVTIAATGSAPVHGSSSTTLEDVTDTATGTARVAGSAGVALEDVTDTATGAVEVRGAVAIALDDVEFTADGTVKIQGIETTTLDALIDIASATVLVRGALAVTLADATMRSTGDVITVRFAELDVTLDDVTLTASDGRIGELAVTLDDVALTASATASGAGLHVTLDGLALDATGVVSGSGVLPYVPPTFGGAASGDGLNLRSKSQGRAPAPRESAARLPITAEPVFELGSRVRLSAVFETRAGMRFDPTRVIATVMSSKGSRRMTGKELGHAQLGAYSIDITLDAIGPMQVRFDGFSPDATFTADYIVQPARRASTRDVEPVAELERVDIAARDRRKKMIDDLRTHGVSVDEMRSDAYIEGQHGELSRRLTKERHQARAAWGK